MTKSEDCKLLDMTVGASSKLFSIIRGDKIDFTLLAGKYPEFARCCSLNPSTGKVIVDFKNSETVRRLFMVTLEEWFGLLVDIPRDVLVPRVPSRLNYILWIDSLLRLSPDVFFSAAVDGDGNHGYHIQDSTSGGRAEDDHSAAQQDQLQYYEHQTDPSASASSKSADDSRTSDTSDRCQMSESDKTPTLEGSCSKQHQQERVIGGIDIGTGASCVYPLLGTSVFGWSFLATERDPVAAKSARSNVAANGLDHKIKVKEVGEGVALENVLCQQDQGPGKESCDQERGVLVEECYDFCMCNPPFYEPGEVEALTDGIRKKKSSQHRPNRTSPHSTTIARSNELCTDGGEVGFVSKIIHDSLLLKDKVKIYTSLVGKKSSVGRLMAALNQAGIKETTSTTLRQGKTHRWVIAWTHHPLIKLNPDNRTNARAGASRGGGGSQSEHSKKQSNHASPSNTNKKKSPPTYEIFVPDELGFDDMDLIRVFTDDLNITCRSSESSASKSWICAAQFATWLHNRRKRRYGAGRSTANNNSNNNNASQEQQQQQQKTIVGAAADEPSNKKQMNRKTTGNSDDRISIPAPQELGALEENRSLSLKLPPIIIQKEDNLISANSASASASASSSAITIGQDQKGQVADSSGNQNQLQNSPKKPPILQFHLTFAESKIRLEWIDGVERDSLHQMVQFIKNYLNSLRRRNVGGGIVVGRS